MITCLHMYIKHINMYEIDYLDIINNTKIRFLLIYYTISQKYPIL